VSLQTQQQFHVLLVNFKSTEVPAEFPYLFKTAGARVDVFCTKNSWLLKNSFWDQWIDCDSADPDVFVQKLQQHIAMQQYDWVVITDERGLEVINTRVTDNCIARQLLPLFDLSNRSVLGSKAGFSRMCTAHNIRTPAYAIYNVGSDLKQIIHDVSFPMLIKTDTGGGGNGIFQCEDFASAETAFAQLSAEQKNNIVFQKYIRGSCISVEALFNKGELLAYAASRVMRTVGTEFNVALDRNYFSSPEIETHVQTIGAAFTIDGFASMTYMHSNEDGQYYLVEADLRANVWFRLASHVGVDFSRAIRAKLTNTSVMIRPIIPGGADCFYMGYLLRNMIWCFEQRDIVRAIKWFCNIGGRWRFVPWYDKKLLFASIVEVLRACKFRLRQKLRI